MASITSVSIMTGSIILELSFLALAQVVHGTVAIAPSRLAAKARLRYFKGLTWKSVDSLWQMGLSQERT
jgi:hypothetical protein